jgi:hypothetical protein
LRSVAASFSAQLPWMVMNYGSANVRFLAASANECYPAKKAATAWGKRMGSAKTEPGAEADPSTPASTYGTWRQRRWLWIGLGPACLVLVVLGVLLGKAAVYQPITWGDESAPFPGLPTGVGVKVVNNFGLFNGGDYYVPPQRGVFSFGVTFYNSGSRPITIDAVALDPPGSGFDPIRLARPVLYTTDLSGLGTPRIHVLHHLTIAAGETIFVGIPMRIWPCGQTDGWMTDPAFYVREHFLFFSHTVALPWSQDGARLIMHLSGGRPSEPHTVCAP